MHRINHPRRAACDFLVNRCDALRGFCELAFVARANVEDCHLKHVPFRKLIVVARDQCMQRSKFSAKNHGGLECLKWERAHEAESADPVSRNVEALLAAEGAARLKAKTRFRDRNAI